MGSVASPSISVILPVYNGQAYLQTCIESVLAQSAEDFELLIADDGSEDGSWEMIERFTDPRIRIWRNKHNLGLFGNLNFLVSQAAAPLVRILCQDDALERECLEAEKLFFQAHPDVGMSYCKAHFVDSSGMSAGDSPIYDLPEVLEPELSLQLFYYLGCLPGNLSTVCVRKTWLDKVGGFNESYRVSGDYEMWVRICKQTNLGIIHQFLIDLRLHNGQLSRAASSNLAAIRENRRILDRLIGELPRKVQRQAKLYRLLRQNVFDTHHAMRCILSRRFREFWEIVRIMGFDDFGLGIIGWLLTVNNHLFRPRPKIYQSTQSPAA